MAPDNAHQEVNVVINRRFDDSALDRFISASPISIKFESSKGGYLPDAHILREEVNRRLRVARTDVNLFAKALLETDNKQFNTAMVCYDEAIEKNPENIYYYINRGALQAEMIDFISSIENNVPVLTLDNDNTVKTRVQEQVRHSYDYTPAIHDMKKAASIDPSFPYIYYNLGNLYCLSDDLPESIVQYCKALELYQILARPTTIAALC